MRRFRLSQTVRQVQVTASFANRERQRLAKSKCQENVSWPVAYAQGSQEKGNRLRQQQFIQLNVSAICDSSRAIGRTVP